MAKLGIKKHVRLGYDLWERFMSFKVDFSMFDGHDRALHYSIDVRRIVSKYDSTRLIRDLFTGEIDEEDFKKVAWAIRHRCFQDMCKIRVALHEGEYEVHCRSKETYKCRRCPLY